MDYWKLLRDYKKDLLRCSVCFMLLVPEGLLAHIAERHGGVSIEPTYFGLPVDHIPDTDFSPYSSNVPVREVMVTGSASSTALFWSTGWTGWNR